MATFHDPRQSHPQPPRQVLRSAGEGCPPAAGAELTAVHCRSRHDYFTYPGPPHFFMSRQKWKSPHSVCTQARQCQQWIWHHPALAPGPPPPVTRRHWGISNAKGCAWWGARSGGPMGTKGHREGQGPLHRHPRREAPGKTRGSLSVKSPETGPNSKCAPSPASPS